MTFEKNVDTSDQSIQKSKTNNELLNSKEKLDLLETIDLADNCTFKNIKSSVSKTIAKFSKIVVGYAISTIVGYAAAVFLSCFVIRPQLALRLTQESPSMQELQPSFTKAVHDQLSVGEFRLLRPLSIEYNGIFSRHEQQAKIQVTQPQSSILTQLNIIGLVNPLSVNYFLGEPKYV